MTHESLADDGWAETIELLGGEDLITQSARETRAFLRPRGVRSASDLLRLTLAYCLGKVGMRGIVAWAAAGGIRIGDRAYLQADRIAKVMAQGGDVVVRAPWKNVRWLDADGEAFDLISHLKSCRDEVIETPVRLGLKKGEPLKMRLIALRKSEAAAEEARRKINKEAKAKSKQV